MLFVWQIPICDARLLSGSKTRLSEPDWPTPHVGSDFVRGFGRVLRRRRGGHEEFPDEGVYAAADHALRFDALHKHPITAGEGAFVAEAAFRRLLCSNKQVGGVCNRLEVGLRIPAQRPRGPSPVRFGSRDWITAALQVAELPVRVRSMRQTSHVQTSLWHCGPPIASAYFDATSPSHADAADAASRRLVSAGSPLLLIEYEAHEATSLPERASAIEPERVGGLHLRFEWLEYRRHEFGVWFLQRDADQAAVTRRLRVGLLRMYAEHQALKAVLSHLLNGRLTYQRGTPASELCDRYLQEAMRILGRDEHGGFSHAAVRHVIAAYQSVVNGDELKLLDERLDQVRRQVRAPVTAYSTASVQQPVAAGLPAPAVEKGDAVRVFVSYSHKDSKYLKEGSLVDFVSGGLRGDCIDFWHDTNLKGADLWDARIREELDRSDIALVLVSQWFLNSRYISEVEATNFIDAMRARGLRIYPVILRKCDWQTKAWLARTESQPRDGKTLEDNYSKRSAREGLFLTVLEELRAISAEIRRQRAAAARA